MKLDEIKLTATNHFVAMEYYALFLNRSYLVIVLDDQMLGLVCNGIVAAEVYTGPEISGIISPRLIKSAVSPLVISGDLDSPLSYINEKNMSEYDGVDLLAEPFFSVHKNNFRYKLSEISSVCHDPKKKWGMGGHPHDGKVYISISNKTRELIPLGQQSGKAIVKNIEDKLTLLKG